MMLLILLCVSAHLLSASGFLQRFPCNSRTLQLPLSHQFSGNGFLKPLRASADFGGKGSTSGNTNDDWDITEVQSRLLLAFVAATYGTNYAAIKELGEVLDPSLVNVLRFAIAALVFSPVFLKNLSKDNIIKGGIEIGFWNSLGYLGQAFALNNGGKAGQVAFIGSLTVVVCSILDYAFTDNNNGGGSQRTFRKTIATFLPSVLSVAGVWLLSQEPPALDLPTIDLLTDTPLDNLVDTAVITTEAVTTAVTATSTSIMSWTTLCTAFMQPICFGLGYFRQCKIVQRCGNKEEYQLLNSAAMITIVTSSIIAYLALHHGIDMNDLSDQGTDNNIIGLLLWTGAGTTAIAGLAESVAVKKLSASETTMIFGTEPLWGTFFGYVLLQEQLSSSAGLGAAVILSAIVLSLTLGTSDGDNSV